MFSLPIASTWSQIWRPLVAMFYAVPLGLWLRSLWLNQGIAPIFVLVMEGVCILAILLWRVLFCMMFPPKG